MRINIAAIDREQFQVEERGAFVLVRPPKIKHTWSLEELHLRSLLCRPDGTVVSAGFPKFFNYGENAAHDHMVDAFIGAGKVVFTEKLDGSLIIRSVVDGVVHLRTRGNHDLGEFTWVRDAIEKDYPAMLDPAIGAVGVSYLFEVTSPLNRIVLAYAETKLTLLARIHLDDLRVMRPDGYEAALFGATLVSNRGLTPADAKEASATILALRGDEGVVAWCERPDGSFLLSKFKSEWYLRAHALKSFATHDRIRDYVWSNGINSREEFIAALMSDGVDWETATQHTAIYDVVKAETDHRLARIDDMVERLRYVRDLPDRKSKALELKDHAGDCFAALIHWAVGDDERFILQRQAYGLGMSSTEFAELRKKGKQKVVLDLEAAKFAE